MHYTATKTNNNFSSAKSGFGAKAPTPCFCGPTPYTYGENYFEMKSTWQTPYKFNAKEKDEETCLYYYGARYYSPELSIWSSVDPMADKYPSTSPYMYCEGKPIIMVDVDGRYSRLGAWIRSIFNKDAGHIYNSGDSWGFNVTTRDENGVRTGHYADFGDSKGNASNFIGAMAHSLIFKTDDVKLTGGLLEKLKKDSNFDIFRKKVINVALDAYNSNPSEQSLTVTSDLIAFGGNTDEPLNPLNSDTKKIMKNELSWVLRHAYINATANISKNGAINIIFSLRDDLDFVPGFDKPASYNIVTSILCTIYHVGLNGKAITVGATWNEIINIYMI